MDFLYWVGAGLYRTLATGLSRRYPFGLDRLFQDGIFTCSFQ